MDSISPKDTRGMGALMNSRIYASDSPETLSTVYNLAIQGVPHTFAVSEREMADAFDGPVCCKAAKGLRGQRIWFAGQGADIHGVIHIALEDQEPPAPSRGIIRFFWYARGHRAAGQALLEQAEAHFRQQGIGRLLAWHYDHTYPFYHVEHAYLSQQLDQVHALLGMNGYAVQGSELVLDWPDFDPSLPDPVDASLKLTINWESGRAQRPGLVLLAHKGEDEVGVCVCSSLGEVSSARQAQDWVYTRWLGVDEAWRGRGLGRYLMRRALHALYDVGYRHATICTLGDNHRAFLLYTNLGYRAVDWTHAYEKALV